MEKYLYHYYIHRYLNLHQYNLGLNHCHNHLDSFRYQKDLYYTKFQFHHSNYHYHRLCPHYFLRHLDQSQPIHSHQVEIDHQYHYNRHYRHQYRTYLQYHHYQNHLERNSTHFYNYLISRLPHHYHHHYHKDLLFRHHHCHFDLDLELNNSYHKGHQFHHYQNQD